MRTSKTLFAPLGLLLLLVFIAGSVVAQVGREALSNCGGMVFSTEEDFITQGPEPADGNPIISDGDLLGLGCVVCARNADLLQAFKVTVDLGLDAVDIIDVESYLIAFSTELDSPLPGQFSAGDLLTTSGAVIPNAALLAQFDLRDGDLGLDAIHFVGETGRIIEFLAYVSEMGPDYWLRSGALQATLRQYGVDIWFSTEGTAPYPAFPAFLDGDLLSARDGVIVAAGSVLLPTTVPAGIPTRGVDFGLDAVSADRAANREQIHFSTEILYDGEMSFTDGDVLIAGNGIVKTNKDLVHCFEPKSDFLGLDALSMVEVSRPPCGAAIIRVGGMPAGSIGSNGLANGPSATTPTFDAQDSPFGGSVELIGLMPSCEDCTEFKFEYAQWPAPSIPPASSAWLPMTDGFKEWTFVWPSMYVLVTRTPDSNGWLGVLCDTIMGGLYYPWNTAAKNGKYSIRLTVMDSGGIEHVSTPVVVMLDNEAPDYALTIFSSPVCGDVFIGDTVSGTITATDPHFYSYRLRYTSSLANGFILPIRQYSSVADTGDISVAFSWNTSGLPACGYRIILEVWDRTIVNNKRSWSEPGFGWRSWTDFYFCLEEAT
ncbi:hypothetical protein ACFLSW_05475 [Candidatus Bipolaricaulota bacterium]